MKHSVYYMLCAAFLLTGCGQKEASQALLLNDLDYFEEQGVNVLVFSNDFNGGFIAQAL